MLILEIVTILLAGGALVAEFARVLMTVQQNSYRPERYRRYLKTSGESTTFAHIFGIIVFLCMGLRFAPDWLKLGAVALFCLCMILRQARLTRTYKHPVVWTPRVWRLFSTMCGLTVLVVGVALLLTEAGGAGYVTAGLLLLAWLLAPQVAQAALWLLKPVEKHINQRYIDDARRILASMPDLRVVGITGSYGKTSTKHYLYRILSEQFPTCMTPGSFNTTLGVVRTIREHLKPFDRIFICEMGAKQPGDVKEICDLVHPEIGIITAVGPQHLESFKTIENVQATKFELVDSLPAGGLAVLNDDFEYVANRPVSNVATVRYGIQPRPTVQYAAGEVKYSANGTDFTIVGPDGELKLHTRLVGECNVSNLIAAVIVARHLGVTPERIAYAVEQIQQVEHRLSVRRTPGGLTVIDDAFNSNPAGSAMALDVLRSMTPGRRFVITPGMIELGPEQEALNEAFGRKIAESADVAIIVGQYNREAILAGLEGAQNCEVHAVDTFAQAQSLMTSMAKAGDTVLYENDLPDTFK